MAENSQVELVAGPLCGMKVKWPHPDTEATFPCVAGKPVYWLEDGKRTAVYIRDASQVPAK